jgi:hypothetical protein
MTLPNDMYPQYIPNVEKLVCKENYQNQSFAAIPNSGAIIQTINATITVIG